MYTTRAAVALLGSVFAGGCVSGPAPRVPEPEPERTKITRGRRLPSGSAQGAALAGRAAVLARSLLRSPYRYSGADPEGFDCSGLTSYVFSELGLAIPRTAQDQATIGRWVALDELAQGDLVFFGGTRAKPDHVGLVVSKPGQSLKMVHSSTSRGVIETEVARSSYWLPRLRFGRRVIRGTSAPS